MKKVEDINKNRGNVVKFPDKLLGDDPIEELLNEFSTLCQEDFESSSEEDESEYSYESVAKNYVETTLKDYKMDDEDHTELVLNQLKLIEETRRRIKYYLDEIEHFLPNKF